MKKTDYEDLIQNKEKFEKCIKHQLLDSIWQKDSAMIVAITELMKLFHIEI